jgi:hypothetical protein
MQRTPRKLKLDREVLRRLNTAQARNVLGGTCTHCGTLICTHVTHCYTDDCGYTNVTLCTNPCDTSQEGCPTIAATSCEGDCTVGDVCASVNSDCNTCNITLCATNCVTCVNC